jgi:O-acetyl-ADP-ribose deacetylase (regulator of RNase III)
MIAYKKGNLLAEEAEALVNTVNCVGVMGRGIALQFKNVYPENFKAYAAACRREEVVPGKMFVYETGQLTNPRYTSISLRRGTGGSRAAFRISSPGCRPSEGRSGFEGLLP